MNEDLGGCAASILAVVTSALIVGLLFVVIKFLTGGY